MLISMTTKGTHERHGFTIVEILVTIGVLGTLLAILLPTLSTIRESSGETRCAGNLRELAAATIAYMSVYDNCLPQVAVDVSFGGGDPSGPGNSPGGGSAKQIIGALFAGKRGELPMFGINEYGVNDRPLNAYIASGRKQIDDTDTSDYNDPVMTVCECPLDRGQKPGAHSYIPYAESLHTLLGCSYTLNDHTLDGDLECTLVPRQSGGKPGGRMPLVDNPSKVWMLGDHPIYNYQEGGDRGQRWHYKNVRCNLAFVDGHVGSGIDIPKGIENTTQHYTFLPQIDWECGD